MGDTSIKWLLESNNEFFFQGAFPLPRLQLARVHKKGGDDPALQVAQEARRVPPARLHALQPPGRLQRQVRQLHAQQEADALPLHQRGMRQGLHIHVGRADARELPQKGLRHHPGGFPEVQGDGGVRRKLLRLLRPEDDAFPLQEDRLQVHLQKQERYG